MSRGYMSQGVYVLGGKCPGGKCPGGKCPGGICPWGKCPGGTCPGGLCPRTLWYSICGYIFNTKDDISLLVHPRPLYSILISGEGIASGRILKQN